LPTPDEAKNITEATGLTAAQVLIPKALGDVKDKK
jgi:hypothetical protein